MNDQDDRTTPAGDELVAEVTALQESNRARMAAAQALLGKLPNMTVGLIDVLADALLGVGTVARWEFTRAWERKVAEWCDATEAEIRKAEVAAGTPAEDAPIGSPLAGVPQSKPRTLHVARGGGMNGL